MTWRRHRLCRLVFFICAACRCRKFRFYFFFQLLSHVRSICFCFDTIFSTLAAAAAVAFFFSPFRQINLWCAQNSQQRQWPSPRGALIEHLFFCCCCCCCCSVPLFCRHLLFEMSIFVVPLNLRCQFVMWMSFVRLFVFAIHRISLSLSLPVSHSLEFSRNTSERSKSKFSNDSLSASRKKKNLHQFEWSHQDIE